MHERGGVGGVFVHQPDERYGVVEELIRPTVICWRRGMQNHGADPLVRRVVIAIGVPVHLALGVGNIPLLTRRVALAQGDDPVAAGRPVLLGDTQSHGFGEGAQFVALC